jgi:hypothetical protein
MPAKHELPAGAAKGIVITDQSRPSNPGVRDVLAFSVSRLRWEGPSEPKMRLWHVIFGVATAAFVLTLMRDPAGRAFVIVFATGTGEVGLGLTAVMALFQTVGAIGEAKGLVAHAEALAATSVVLTLATGLMSGWLFAGFWLITQCV